MRIPYESEMINPDVPFDVEMHHDEMMAIVSIICNRYGWSKAERRGNNMPPVLEYAMMTCIEGAQKATR